MFKKIKPYLVSILISVGVGALSAFLTRGNMDIYEEIKGFDGDVLIVHGSKDKNVDITYSQKAYETYLSVESKREEPREVLFRIVEKGKHGFDGKYAEMAMEYMKEVV